MKKQELKKINPSELPGKLEELKKELMKYRAQIATGTPPDNPGKIKSIKKTIATMNLLLHKLDSKKQGKEVRQKSNARN